MGGGSGLLKSLKGIGSSSKKKKSKKQQQQGAVAGVEDVVASSPSPRNGGNSNKATRYPGGGGVAITCGSGRSLFRGASARGLDDDLLLASNLVPPHSLLGETTATASSSSAASVSSSSQQQTGSTEASATATLTTTPTKTTKEAALDEGAESSSTPSSFSMRTPGSTSRTIRGKEVASKAALFEGKSRQNNSNSNSPVRPGRDAGSVSSLSPPPNSSRRIANLNKQPNFWKDVLQQTSSEENEQDLVSIGSMDVKKKTQWLQSAFSPTGGGNMPDVEDDITSLTQDLTETMHDEEQESVSVLSESLYTTNTNTSTSSPSYYNYWTAHNTPPRKRSPEAPPAMTDQDSLWRDAYLVWFQHGLLPWKPSQDSDDKEVKTATKSAVVVGTPVIAAPTNAVEDEQEQFHDSVMALDEDPSVSGHRGGAPWMAGETPASPGSVQASRTLHRTMTQTCPLLTVFGGGGGGSGSPAAKLTLPSLTTSTPHVATKIEKTPTKTLSSKSTSSSVSSSSPIKLVPSLTPSPTQLYSNYVTAYTAYVQDRHNPTKAAVHREARRLLEMSRQPLYRLESGTRGA